MDRSLLNKLTKFGAKICRRFRVMAFLVLGHFFSRTLYISARGVSFSATSTPCPHKGGPQLFIPNVRPCSNPSKEQDPRYRRDHRSMVKLQLPYSTLIFGVFSLHQIAHVGVSERMGLKLLSREIIFEEFQPM